MEQVDQDAPWAKDRMDRQRVARFLTRHLDNSSHIKVLNVNSEWGSGKTFFITEWQKEVKGTRVCVYFDAWKHDYTGDPFVSLVATIKDQLAEQISDTAKAKKTLASFTKSAAKTLLAATPVVAKGLVKKLSSVDVDAIHEAIEVVGDAPADAAEKAIEELINQKKAALKSVDDFKKIFNKLLAEAVINKGENPMPAYIFIDELDRCRPTFAIELLERIKHLFDIQACKFIIASDTAQLAHSITAIYGNNFESNKYLKRFFDAEFELDNSNMEEWIKTLFTDPKLDQYSSTNLPIVRLLSRVRYDERTEITVEADADTLIQNDGNGFNARQIVILALVKTFKPKLRELEKLVHQINAFEGNCTTKHFQFFWAAYLLFLKDADRNRYRLFAKDSSGGEVQELEQAFPSAKLFFGDANASVHQIARHYIRASKLTHDALRKQLDHEPPARYIAVIYANYYAGYGELQLYPGLVDLAHRLDS